MLLAGIDTFLLRDWDVMPKSRLSLKERTMRRFHRSGSSDCEAILGPCRRFGVLCLATGRTGVAAPLVTCEEIGFLKFRCSKRTADCYVSRMSRSGASSALLVTSDIWHSRRSPT